MPGAPGPIGIAFPWDDAIERLPHAVAVIGADRRPMVANGLWRDLVRRRGWDPLTVSGDLAGAVEAALSGSAGEMRGEGLGDEAVGWFDWVVARVSAMDQPHAVVWLHDARPRRQAEAAAGTHMEFLRALAHDIGSPLQTVVGFSELLRQRVEAEPNALVRPDYLRMIDSASRQAVARFGTWLELAQALFAPSGVSKAPVRLGTLVRDVVAALGSAAAARGVDLVLEKGPDPLVECDGNDIKRCLIAVAGNAINIMPKDCAVNIALEGSTVDGFVFRVSDHGPRIAAAELERFQQSAIGTELRRDLALALARALMRRQNGDIAIESGPEDGTIVRLRLPASSSMASTR